MQLSVDKENINLKCFDILLLHWFFMLFSGVDSFVLIFLVFFVNGYLV